MVLAVNGESEVLVQSAQGYRELLNVRDLLESIRAIGRGLEQAKKGEGLSMRGFLAALAAQHRIGLA